LRLEFALLAGGFALLGSIFAFSGGGFALLGGGLASQLHDPQPLLLFHPS
jgi:hypothetical protein